MRFRDFSIVIEQDGVKRRLDGPFRLCLSRADADRLREQLCQADHDGFGYGWINIVPELADDSFPNTPPRAWKD